MIKHTISISIQDNDILLSSSEGQELLSFKSYADHVTTVIDESIFIWMRFHNNESDFSDYEIFFEKSTYEASVLLEKLLELKVSSDKKSAA